MGAGALRLQQISKACVCNTCGHLTGKRTFSAGYRGELVQALTAEELRKHQRTAEGVASEPVNLTDIKQAIDSGTETHNLHMSGQHLRTQIH